MCRRCQGGSFRSIKSSSGSDRRLSDLSLDLVALLCQVSLRLLPTAPINRAGPWLGSDESRFLSARGNKRTLTPETIYPSFLSFPASSAAKFITAGFLSTHLHSWRRRTGAVRGNTSAHRERPQRSPGHKLTFSDPAGT